MREFTGKVTNFRKRDYAMPESEVRAAYRAVQLTPIPWGEPDAALARALCWHISDATPPVVIRFNPFTHRRVVAFLRSCGIVH